jgi:hypothetical protein
MDPKMGKHIILGVHITNRTKNVAQVQQVLSEFGCFIKTRLGLHEASDNFCSPNGLIILEMIDNDLQTNGLISRLNAVGGVEVQQMIFEHP